jgi:hypothetical protein
LNDLPPGSGLPAWAWESYEIVAAVLVGVACGSLIAGVVSRVMRRQNTGHRAHAAVVSAAMLLVIGWTAVAGLGSVAPPGGMFCYAPAAWATELPATCVAQRPFGLLFTPLVAAMGLGVLGFALALPRSARYLTLGLAIAAVVLDIGAATQIALVQPGVFDAGGITSVPEAVVRLLVDPIHALLGLAVAVALVVVRRLQRTSAGGEPAQPP